MFLLATSAGPEEGQCEEHIQITQIIQILRQGTQAARVDSWCIKNITMLSLATSGGPKYGYCQEHT